MSRSKPKKQRKKRVMSRSRVEAAKQIEQPIPKDATTPILPPPPDLAAAKQQAKARELGLSVGRHESKDLIDRRMVEFDRVANYVAEVWQHLTGEEMKDETVSRDDWNGFISRLMQDGHLASRINERQRQRESQPTPMRRDRDFRHVARAMRKEFGAHMPRRFWRLRRNLRE